MGYTAITPTETNSGKPITTSLMNKVRQNLDDLDSRVASLGGNFILFNELLNYKALPQGAMMWTLDTPANFSARMGSEWVVVDSSSGTFVDGNGNAQSIPNASSHFLLNKGSGVDTLRNLLSERTKMPVNPYTMNSTGAHTHTYTTYSGTTSGLVSGTGGKSTVSGSTSSNGNHSHTISGGDSRNLPKTLVGNLMIKVSDDLSARRLVFRASSAMTLNTAKVTQMVAGPSGTLEIDILKGSSLAGLTTVFSTRPSLLFSAGNYASSSNAIFSDTAVAPNDWIVLHVVSLQSVHTEFHIQIEAAATT